MHSGPRHLPKCAEAVGSSTARASNVAVGKQHIGLVVMLCLVVLCVCSQVAPELFVSGKQSKAADVYSYGMMGESSCVISKEAAAPPLW